MAQQLINSAGCSCKGSKFDFQHSHGGSQPSVETDTGDLIPSFGFLGYQTCIQCIDISAGKTVIPSWAVVAHAFNPSTQEAEEDGSL